MTGKLQTLYGACGAVNKLLRNEKGYGGKIL
jgi:hypothetical protein